MGEKINAQKIFGENAYVNLDEVIETVYQCRADVADREWEKRWLEPLIGLEKIEVSEDAISREWVGVNMLRRGFHAPDMKVGEFLEDAPSVIPKPKEGEWIDRDGWKFCSECNNRADEQANGVAIEPLCTNYCCECGAKMKGADNE